jgi:hypothetical protein
VLSPLNRSTPVVDADFKPLQVLQLFSEETARLYPLSGTGSPEGVLEATLFREYVDLTGAAGAVKYIKRLADIGGDRKMGWVAI